MGLPVLDPSVAARRLLPGRRHRAWWPVIWGGGASGVVVLAAIVGTVLAIAGASTTSCRSGSGSSGQAPTKAATAAIPPERLAVYEQAGARFDIDWTFLAAIGVQECASGDCYGTNSSGCAGPMQIAYVPDSPCSPGSGRTLWAIYKVSASGGTPDVNNFADAVYTAARILRQDKGAPAVGGSYRAYYLAACGYYGACSGAGVAYAKEVMARAVRFGFVSGSATSAVSASSGSGGSGCSSSTSSSSGSSSPALGSRIVQVAETQLGVKEDPWGSNCTRYGPCEEWCALFVAWVWEHAGVRMSGGTSPYAYAGTIYTWVAEHGGRDLAPTARPAPGDAVLYGSGVSDSVHIGIVEQVFADGEIVTIEGNDDNQVLRNGPFYPTDAVAAGEPAAIYGYAQPPTSEKDAADA